MSRPIYESDSDLDNEIIVRHWVEQATGTTLSKLPISYGLDYAVCGNDRNCLGWMEVKTRDFEWGAYPTIMLSLLKWMKGLEFVQKTGLPFIFTIMDSLQNMYSITTTTDKQYKPFIEWGGRTVQTRDSADVEPVVHIPIEWFKHLNRKGE